MTQIVQAVPNFSEGRDPEFALAVADAFARTGCEVLHTTSDPDHHRSVVTAVGSPGSIEAGAVEVAMIAFARIDMRRHHGVHPRVGALDVLPFVPMQAIDTADTVRLARRAGARIADLGVPVYFYARASEPPGRGLAPIRRGGFEGLADDGASGRPEADLPGKDKKRRKLHRFAHPSAGAACVGVRRVLLAWNVDVSGIRPEAARAVAARIRETGGGFRGLRALALQLPAQGRLQISMNLEDPAATDPRGVYDAIRLQVEQAGGRLEGTEVIGMLPDALCDPAVAREMRVRDWSEERILCRRVEGFARRLPPRGGP